MIAARNGHAAVVDILLRASADKTITDAEGMNALDYAKQEGFSGIVAQFVSASEPKHTRTSKK